MLRQRLATRGFASRVRLDLLLSVCIRERIGELSLLALVEDEREDVERKLRAVILATL